MFLLRVVSLCVISCLFSGCSDSSHAHPLFNYDLHVSSVEGSRDVAVICFHGFGGDHQVGRTVTPFFKEKATVISFNFPDYGDSVKSLDPEKTSFGTIQELLPALYVLKQSVIDNKFQRVCLYGFSAGGAALINCLSVLNGSFYDRELKTIGIKKAEKKKILEVLQRGDVILDTPLKSIDELFSLYGKTKELEVIGVRYQKNGMDPIESVKKWKSLTLNVLVHFQVPDKVLSNRDDEIFVEVLKKYNRGKTNVLIGSDTGHLLPHPSLWEYYLKNSSCF